MLDRERADFFRTLESLKQAFGQHVVATEIPIGAEHELEGVIDLIDMKAYRYDGAGRENCSEVEIPEALQRPGAGVPREADGRGRRGLRRADGALPRGRRRSPTRRPSRALKTGVTEGKIFPVTCGAATRNLGTNRLLDALVEDLPSPAKKGPLAAGERRDARARARTGELVAFVFKTLADPFAGRLNLFRVYQGVLEHDSQVQSTAARTPRSASASCWCPRARTPSTPTSSAPATSARWRSSRRPTPATCCAAHEAEIALALPTMPKPVMAFAIEAKARVDEEKMGAALRRLQEEDPTIDFHRDAQTGEQIVAGLTQIHVEVIVERMKDRFGAEVELHPPRVPYRETIKGSAKAHARYKKQSGGRGQFADCQIEIEPLRRRRRLRVRERDQGRRDPRRLHPGRREGHPRGDAGRRGRRLPGRGRARAAVRRPAPRRRLLGDGVQDGRLDGLQGRDGAGAAGADGADHDRQRARARGLRRRRDRRPQLAPRAPAGDGAQGRA